MSLLLPPVHAAAVWARGTRGCSEEARASVFRAPSDGRRGSDSVPLLHPGGGQCGEAPSGDVGGGSTAVN